MNCPTYSVQRQYTHILFQTGSLRLQSFLATNLKAEISIFRHLFAPVLAISVNMGDISLFHQLFFLNLCSLNLITDPSNTYSLLKEIKLDNSSVTLIIHNSFFVTYHVSTHLLISNIFCWIQIQCSKHVNQQFRPLVNIFYFAFSKRDLIKLKATINIDFYWLSSFEVWLTQPYSYNI